MQWLVGLRDILDCTTCTGFDDSRSWRRVLREAACNRQLSRLRDVFDDPLLLPAQRGMTPTAKAIEQLESLRQALDQVRATVGQRAFNPATTSLTVAIACTDYLHASVVMPLVATLRSRARGVRVALRYLHTAELEARMTRDDVDLILMTPHAAPPRYPAPTAVRDFHQFPL